MEPNLNQIKVIIGLGNPTKQYENTYHNIGELTINYILKKIKNYIIFQKSEDLFEYFLVKINKRKIYFVLPKTYMNDSGRAIFAILKKFKVQPENILIIQDDSDLYVGNYKYAFNGSSAGHHGIESIFNILKYKNFWRLRIGIRPTHFLRAVKAEKFVLEKISYQDKKIFYSLFDKFIEKLIENIFPSGKDLIFCNGKSID